MNGQAESNKALNDVHRRYLMTPPTLLCYVLAGIVADWACNCTDKGISQSHSNLTSLRFLINVRSQINSQKSKFELVHVRRIFLDKLSLINFFKKMGVEEEVNKCTNLSVYVLILNM